MIAKIMRGTVIFLPGLGTFASSSGSSPKNIRRMVQREYPAVKTVEIIPAAAIANNGNELFDRALPKAPAKIIHSL